MLCWLPSPWGSRQSPGVRESTWDRAALKNRAEVTVRQQTYRITGNTASNSRFCGVRASRYLCASGAISSRVTMRS